MDKDTLLLKLNEKWKCSLEFGWIPITGDDEIANTEVYDSDYFEYYIDEVKKIIENIAETTTIFELREDGRLRELNLIECDFRYDGLEYIYTDRGFSFVLYFSHENSTTVGGERLLHEIHRIWPDYSIHFWKPFWGSK